MTDSIFELEKRLQRALTREKTKETVLEMIALAPAEAYPLILKQFGHSEAEIQTDMLHLLAEYYPQQAADVLLDNLQNSPAWDVRAAAAQALVTCADEGLITQLGKLSRHTDWDLVSHVVKTLGEIAQPACLPFLLTASAHPNPFVRKRVAEALVHFPWDRTIEAALLTMLTDNRPDIVYKVVQCLGKSPSYEAYRYLQNLLTQTELAEELPQVIQKSCMEIQTNMKNILQQSDLAPLEQVALLKEWITDGTIDGLKETLEKQVAQTSQKLTRYSPSEREAYISTVLEIDSAHVIDVQEGLLKSALELPDLTLKTLSSHAQHKAESILLKALASPAAHDFEKRKALELLLIPKKPEILSQLLFLLDDPSEMYLQLRPLFALDLDETLKIMTAYFRKNPPVLGQQRVIELLLELRKGSTVPFLLRLLRDSQEEGILPLLRKGLSHFGATIVPLLNEELSRTPDLNYKKELLTILSGLPLTPEIGRTLLGMLGTQIPEMLKQVAFLLTRLDTHTAELLERVLNENLTLEQRALARHILEQRGTQTLFDLMSLLPLYSKNSSHVDVIKSLILTLIQAAPAGNSALLTPLLKHQQTDIRYHGIDLIARLGDDASLSQIIQLLRDPAPTIRQQISQLLPKWGLKILPDLLQLLLTSQTLLPVITPILAQLGSSPLLVHLHRANDVRQQKALIQALAQTGDVQAAPHVLPFCYVTDLELQLSSLKALVSLKNVPASFNPTTLLDNPQVEVKAQTIRCLGFVNEQVSLPLITPFLKSPELVLRYAAIESLGRLQTVAYLPDLLAFLREANHTQNSELKQVCIDALGQMHSVAALQALTQFLSQETSTDLQEQVLTAIAEIRLPEAVNSLITHFQSAELPLQLKILELLGRTQQNEAYEFLLHHIDDWPLELQRKAIDVLGQASEFWLLPHLLRHLRHENWLVQRSAIEALGHFAHMSALNPLKDRLQELQANQHVWGWILRSAIWDALEAIRGKSVSEA